MGRIKSTLNTRHRKTLHNSPQIANASQTNTPIRKLCGPRSNSGHAHDHIHRRTTYTAAPLPPTIHLHQLRSQLTINSLTRPPSAPTKNTFTPQIEHPQKHTRTQTPFRTSSLNMKTIKTHLFHQILTLCTIPV